MSSTKISINFDPDFESQLQMMLHRKAITPIQVCYLRSMHCDSVRKLRPTLNKTELAKIIRDLANSDQHPEHKQGPKLEPEGPPEGSSLGHDQLRAVKGICEKLSKRIPAYYKECAADSFDAGPFAIIFPNPKWLPTIERIIPAPDLTRYSISRVLSDEDRARFEQLFGCPPEQADKGLIVIQADACEPILSHLKLVREILAQRKEEHLKDPDPDPGPVEKGKFDPRRVPEAVDIPPPSRLFKARFWINKWDTDGAIAIAEAFQKWGRPPKLDLRSHKPSGGRPQQTDAPFEIAMGLGFADPTAESIRECSYWMFKAVWWDCGDALALHKDFVPRSAKKFLDILEAGKKHRDFKRILPRGWRSNTSGGADGIDHMSEWISENSVEDYAIVFRGVTHGQVHWVLAGFTENGTAAAGHFLGNKWATDIWDCAYPRHVKESFPEEFMVVIHGPSDRPEEWEPVKALTITPAKLHSRGWSKRNGKWIKSGKSKKRVTKRSVPVT